MTTAPIRPAFSKWPQCDSKLRDAVARLTGEQLQLKPAPERWPIWATIGHAACQRVFWLCDFADEPGAHTTLPRSLDAGDPGRQRPGPGRPVGLSGTVAR
ncbi:MAG TPA: DinB family protein [Candidatus Limnocylindrales bacterium]|nr:DinB family protein [Candidatus Limnocylindrales bacterium]